MLAISGNVHHVILNENVSISLDINYFLQLSGVKNVTPKISSRKLTSLPTTATQTAMLKCVHFGGVII